MKAISLELTKDVVSSYDQNKTTVLGRAAKKTLTALQGGKTVVGTPLNTWADTITDALVTPARECVSDNGHELQFVASTAGGLVGLVLYDVDEVTGLKTYVGRLNLQLPATTHTIRGVRLQNDSGATGWRILIGSIGTAPALGGLFSAESIDKADFTSSPATIPAATGVGQKAVYWHQETGGTNNLTIMQGFGSEKDAGLSGQKIVAIHGLVASPQGYVFDAANAITSVGVGGVTTDWYVTKTGSPISGWSGTFLLLNNFSIGVPDASSGAPAALQGQTCLFIPTSTNMGWAKISEFTTGVTTIPSYTTRDLLDVSNTNTALTPATMHWSQTLQRVVFQLNNGQWVVKKFVNAEYEAVFGRPTDPQYKTAQPIAFHEFGGITVASTYEHAGWLYMVQNTAGQIGCSAFDLRSLWQYDFSKIISKVFDVEGQWLSFHVNTPVRSFGKFWYRTNLTCDFSDTTTGWVAMPEDRMLSAISFAGVTKGQIMIETRMERDSVTIPIQVIEATLVVQPALEMSDYWDFSDPDSLSTSPARAAFSQIKAWTGGSKHWEFFAYNRDTGALFTQRNTQDHASEFKLSTNDGLSFSPLAGAVASAPLTNVLSYEFSSPPGIKLRVALREKA